MNNHPKREYERDCQPPYNKVPYVKSKITEILCPENGWKVLRETPDTPRYSEL